MTTREWLRRLREWRARATHSCRPPHFSQGYADDHRDERWECPECGSGWTFEWVEDLVALEGTAVADIGGWEWVRA